MGAVVAVASGNPVGLMVSSGMKIYGEASGKSKLEGRAKATAGEIAPTSSRSDSRNRSG
jgi:hypothetical protein